MIDLTVIPLKIRRRIIFLAKRGSYTYGTNNENSDNDYIAIYIPDYEQQLDLLHSNNKIENFHIQVDNNDFIVYPINHFVKYLYAGNMNYLESLFLRDKDIIICNLNYFNFKSKRKLYLSQRVYPMVTSFVRKFINELKESNKYDKKDWKAVMHAYRLSDMAIEILNNYTTQTYRNNNWYLKHILEGKISKDDMIKILKNKILELDISYKNSIIPIESPVNVINNILIRINRDAIDYPVLLSEAEIMELKDNYE